MKLFPCPPPNATDLWTIFSIFHFVAALVCRAHLPMQVVRYRNTRCSCQRWQTVFGHKSTQLEDKSYKTNAFNGHTISAHLDRIFNELAWYFFPPRKTRWKTNASKGCKLVKAGGRGWKSLSRLTLLLIYFHFIYRILHEYRAN